MRWNQNKESESRDEMVKRYQSMFTDQLISTKAGLEVAVQMDGHLMSLERSEYVKMCIELIENELQARRDAQR